MWTVLIPSSVDVATTIGKVLGERFEILLRVEHGLLEMIQESLQVSVPASVGKATQYTLIVET